MISIIQKRVAKGEGGLTPLPFSDAAKQRYLWRRRVWGRNKITKCVLKRAAMGW